MKTNMDDDHVPINNGDSPCNDEQVEGSTQVTSCQQCAELQEELEQNKRDRAFYTSIKKKITLTDTLIRKYNSKCQEFDQQQRKLEDVAYKLASSKRDCKILEQQLTTTLEEVIPWKMHKDKYLKDLEENKAKLKESNDKLAGSEASCVQFKDGFYEMKEKLETLGENQADLKKASDKRQQAEKKASSLLAKNKDDLSTCKKELQNVKRREAKLVNKHQQAMNKIAEFIQILQDRGIPAPKMPKSLYRGSVCSQDSASTEDTDYEQVGEVFSPPMEFLSPARNKSPVVKDRLEREGDTGRPSFKDDACLKIFDRFSCDMSVCVSPLPPSPVLSDASSDISRNKISDDEAFSDVADQIESQFELLDTDDVRDAHKESKEEVPRAKRRLRQTPQRRAVAQRKSRVTDAERQDDSEEEASRTRKPFRRRWKGSNKGMAGTSIQIGKPADVVEAPTKTESEASGDCHAGSHGTGGSAAESDRQGSPGKGKSVDNEESKSLDEDKYQERHFNKRKREDLLECSSTLSDDSDDNQENTKNLSKEPSSNQTSKNSPVADLGSPITVTGRHQLSPQVDLRKSQDDTSAEHKKLVIMSPDRRLTRSQLKTLAEQEGIEPTDAVLPSLSSDQNPPKKSPPKLSVEHPEQDKHAPKRLVTRSLSLSEIESSTECASQSPARPFGKRLLRSNSAVEEKPSSEVPSTPEQLRHSVSLIEQTSSVADENPETKNEDTKQIAVEHKDNISKKFGRSVSVPENKTSEMVIENLDKFDDGRSSDDTSVRRITRSQAQHLQSQDKNEIPKRITRSAAKNPDVILEARVLLQKILISPRLGKKTNIDSSAIKDEDKECTKRGLEKTSTESQDSNIAGSSSLLANSESRNSEQVFNCETANLDNTSSASSSDLETPNIFVISRSSCSKNRNDGGDIQGSSEIKHDDAVGLKESSLAPQTDQEVSGSKKDLEVGKESENEPSESKNDKKKADAASQNGGRSTLEQVEERAIEAVQETQENKDGHLKLDEPQVVKSEQAKQGKMFAVPEKPSEVDRFVGETSKSDSEDGQPEGTPTLDVTLSSLEEPNSKSDDSGGVFELEEGENLRENQEMRNELLTRTSANPSGSLCLEDTSNQGALMGDNQEAQHQVLCVEAESSRASTPTTNEVSINSVAGHVSPVYSLPLQDPSRPLSPFLSSPRSSPLSPLAPSPISLEGFFSMPRMLSPLPPSPGISDFESPDDIGPYVSTEDLPGPSLVNQLRMISPLFPTPVPPAVSPLPEAPIASVLSPLSDASPARPRNLDHGSAISPLRNPLIPSPCNFHAVAPSDALAVRPQHCPPSRRQPASRCLAVSFTSTSAGTIPNPEIIISPRLQSLASEMIFEFGESRPSTSGLQRPLPSQSPTSFFKQDPKENQASACTETLKDPKLQRQRSGTSGFMELGSKSSASKSISEDSAIKKQLEANSRSVLDSCEVVQERMSKDDKMTSWDGKDSDQPKTRTRIKQNSSSIKDLEKFPHKLRQKKTAEEETGPSSNNTAKAHERRHTRSQVVSGRGPPPSGSSSLGGRRETPSIPCRKGDAAENDSKSFSKMPKRRKMSKSCPDQTEMAVKESTSQPKGQMSVSGVKQENEYHESANSTQPVRSGPPSGPPQRGCVLLIPSLELKTNVFKRSCSLRKRQVQHGDEEESVKPDFKVEISAPGVSAEEATEDLEKKYSVPKHSVSQRNGNVLQLPVKQENANTVLKSSDFPGRHSSSTMQQPALKLDPDSRSMPRSGQLAQTPGIVRPKNESLIKLEKPKPSIGSIWGDMAARKDPGMHIFTYKTKKEKKGNRQGPSRPQVGPSPESQNCERVGGGDNVTLHHTKETSAEVTSSKPRASEKLGKYRGLDAETVALTQGPERRNTPQAIGSSLRHPICSLPQMSQATSPLSAASSLSATKESTINSCRQPAGDSSKSTVPSSQSSPAVSVTSERLQNKPRKVTPEVKAPDRQTLQSLTGLKQDQRKRQVSWENNLACNTDEQPSPCKQAKMSPGHRSLESRSEFKQPKSDVAPSAQEVKSKEPYELVLSDLLEPIKKMRTHTNTKPLFASVLKFLGQKAISLMPVIQAKCLHRNTSTRALLLPHEEELVAGIVESGLLSKKSNTSMLLSYLCRGVHCPPPSTRATPAVVSSASFCRVFAALCRRNGLIDRVRIFCYDLLREGFHNAEELLLNIAVTWPTVLRKKEGSSLLILAAMEIVAMQRLVLVASPHNLQAQEIIHCLSEVCGWQIPDGNLTVVRCQQLVASIQDTSVTKLFNTGSPTQALTPRAYEIVKALELLACHLGWPWTNNCLIRDKLWPILKNWSQQVQTATTGTKTGASRNKLAPTGAGHCLQSPADASACAVMKVIGGIASLGLGGHKESVCELLQMLAAVLQQPSASVPWTVQVFTAEAVLCLSPSDPTFALGVTQKWRQQAQLPPPRRIEDKLCVLAKVAGAIQSASK